MSTKDPPLPPTPALCVACGRPQDGLDTANTAAPLCNDCYQQGLVWAAKRALKGDN
jgi:NMD protein affecting ribosome stability and mRNA decay